MWMPPKVRMELLEAKRQMVRDIATSVYVHDELEDWSRELRQIDPGLSLIKAKDDSVVLGLRPGFYHVLRVDPLGGPPTLIPLEGEDGEFREPGSWMFEMLRRMDMWSDRSVKQQRRLMVDMERARDRRREQELAEMEEEILERWKAATMARVSFNRDNPWSQNVAGRRGAAG